MYNNVPNEWQKTYFHCMFMSHRIVIFHRRRVYHKLPYGQAQLSNRIWNLKHLRPSEVKYHIKVTSSYWVHRFKPVFMETVPGAAHVGKAVTHSEWNRSREVMFMNEGWRGVDFPTQKPATHVKRTDHWFK